MRPSAVVTQFSTRNSVESEPIGGILSLMGVRFFLFFSLLITTLYNCFIYKVIVVNLLILRTQDSSSNLRFPENLFLHLFFILFSWCSQYVFSSDLFLEDPPPELLILRFMISFFANFSFPYALYMVSSFSGSPQAVLRLESSFILYFC